MCEFSSERAGVAFRRFHSFRAFRNVFSSLPFRRYIRASIGSRIDIGYPNWRILEDEILDAIQWRREGNVRVRHG